MKNVFLFVGIFFVLLGCSSSSDSASAPTATASELSASVVSGSINSGDSTVASFAPRLQRHRSEFHFIPSAYADTVWTCTAPTITENGSTVTTYPTAAATYLYNPGSCSIAYGDGIDATSAWSGSWSMTYNATCTVTGTLADFKIQKQPSGCILTKTAASGVSRTLTGPDGNVYGIIHNTDGSGTGYNSNISVNNTGVQYECTSGAGPCTAGTLTINGSHLTGTYNGLTYWNHTVTTGTPLSVTLSATTKTIASGTIVVQHNILQTTSTSTFSNVVYSKADCCFPVSGTISTTYSGGNLDGKTESLTFDGSSCGIGTVTKTNGSTAALQLIHCI